MFSVESPTSRESAPQPIYAQPPPAGPRANEGDAAGIPAPKCLELQDYDNPAANSFAMMGCWERRILTVSLSISLIMGCQAPAAAASSLSGLEAQLQSVNVALSQDDAKAAVLQQQATEAEIQLGQATSQVALTQQQISSTAAAASSTQAAMNRTNARLAQTRNAVRRERKGMDAMLLFTEQNGPGDYLDVLLGVSSFQEFATRLSEIAQVVTFQTSMMRRLAKQASAIHSDLSALGRSHAKLNRQQASLLVQHTHLSNVAIQRASVLQQLHAEQQQLAAVAADLKAQEQKLWSAIEELKSELASGNFTSAQILSIVKSISAIYGIDPLLVMAVIRQESGGNAKAVSSAGAKGLMQLMPQTAAELGVSNPFDPQQNVHAGIAYLAYLIKLFSGNVSFALAAYNAGPAAVEHYHGIPPYPETQNYVKNIMWMYQHGI